MALLELRSITKEFPGVRALDGVSFDLEEGEVHALCGENGAGKSTLIKILCGFYPSGTYGGEILLRGQPVHFRTLKAAESHGIALIAQELALVPELSVAENLVLGHEPMRRGLIDWDAVAANAQTALARVGLDVDPDRPVKELGIGQQQMVEIAKALSKDARILVLDEPTAALTEADAQRLLAVIGELRARGVSSIYISHRLEEVFQIADRITVLRDGRSVATHPTARAHHGQGDLDDGRPRGEEPLPAPDPGRGQVAAQGRGLVGGGPGEPGPPGAAQRRLRGAPGRGAGHRRPHGRRAHRPRQLAVRRRAQPGDGAPVGGRGPGPRAVQGPVGGDRGRPGPGERGPQAVRARAGGVDRGEHDPGHAAAVHAPRAARSHVPGGAGEDAVRRAAHQGAGDVRHRQPALRREPAEGRAGEVADVEPAGAVPGRADARDRRGREVGDLPAHRDPRGAPGSGSCSCPRTCPSCWG